MKIAHAGYGAVLALVVACGAAGPEESAESTDVATGDATSVSQGDGAVTMSLGDREELARIERDDGNVVMFERLGDGLLIMETGPVENEKHSLSDDANAPAQAFRRLAPGRAVPDALLRFDAKLADGLAALKAQGATDQLVPRGDMLESGAGEVEQLDAHEIERTGEFQQSGGAYPYSTFLSRRCNFNITSQYDFKHGNSNSGHSHIAARSHRTYVAAASDVGDATIQFCSTLDGKTNCNPPYQVAQGYDASLTFNAGFKSLEYCKSCVFGYCIGCKTLLFAKYPEVRLTSTAIASNERFHDCGWFVPEGL